MNGDSQLNKKIVTEITHNKKREEKEIIKEIEFNEENKDETVEKQFKVEKINTQKKKSKTSLKPGSTKKIKKL